MDLNAFLDNQIGRAPAQADGQRSNEQAPKANKQYRPPPPWQPFPTDTLPEPVKSYVKGGARAIGCDPAYIALPLLAGLASSIGATRRIELKPGWCEPCVIWAAVVGESGTLKSPAMSYGLDALKRLQGWKLQELPELIERYERDMLLYAADLATWKKKGRANNEPPPEKPEEPSVARYLVDDVTLEALADRLRDAPRGLMVPPPDELGSWLGSFDQYRAGRGGDCPRWLSMHRAESLLVDRKSGVAKTIFIRRAAVSVVGGVQPRTLTRALGDKHFENGLAARLLVAMPPRHPKRWTEATVAPELHRRMELLFGRLLALDFEPDNNEMPAPVDLKLTAESKAAWVSFYDRFGQEQNALAGSLGAAYSKLEGYCARLSLVMHLVRLAADDSTLTDPEAVDEVSIAAGVELATWFALEAERVYQALHETDQEAEVRQIVELIQRRGGSIGPRDLRRGMRRFRDDPEGAAAALNSLGEAGVGEWETVAPGDKGGRPTAVFRLSTEAVVDETPSKPEKSIGFVDGDGVDIDKINQMFAGAAEDEEDRLLYAEAAA